MTTHTQVVMLTFADGSLGVMRFVTVDERAGWGREATQANIAAEIARTLWPAEKGTPVSWRLGTEAEVPADRTYRNAYVDRGAKVELDMPRARELHRTRLRRMRAPKLEALDVQHTKALEAGDQKAAKAVAARKQRLRDVTADPGIEQAESVDALHAHFKFADVTL